ncbi:MAG: hypothetical protein JW929_09830 [Anaerolineales bacterium]|nr:hypothetical protein [Anaerolineales bacterium]
MRMRRERGATLALYAAFLVLVGLPLMALTVDASRAYLANVRLRGATQAGCLAYVRSLDAAHFIDTGETRLSGSAAGNAYQVFLPSAPRGATLEIVPMEKDGRVVALCTGKLEFHGIIPVVSVFHLKSEAAAKADFATARNW